MSIARTTASLVCYRTLTASLEPLLRTLRDDPSISTWVVVDNAAGEVPAESQLLSAMTRAYGGQYIAMPRNVGFGAGHNAALNSLRPTPSEFHVMLNPDIAFDRVVVPALAAVMDSRPSVGLIMPKVIYPDRSTQYLCKLLPSPLDFALRRFAPAALQRLARARMERYELRDLDTSQPAEVPFLSGCFMFTRRSSLESTGGFDERFFLYMEDVDLCRRLARIADLLYWPEVFVAHTHARGSHTSVKLMLAHLRSAWVYYGKWGWIFDAEGKRINQAALSRLPKRPLGQGTARDA